MKSIQTLLTAIHAQKVRLNRFRRSSFALLMAFSIVAPDVLALSVTIQNRLSPISLETEGVLMTGTVKINEEPVEEFRYPMFLDAESAPEVPVTNYSVYAEGIALIGVSKNDPTNNPSDDVFTLQIQEKLEEDYILSYEVYGIASGASIPKSVNYGSTYREGRLEASQNWSTAHERILSDDVKVGENKIHFTLPSRLNAGAKVQNVRITPVSKFEGQAPEMTSFKPLQLDRRGFFNLGGALHFSVAALDADDMPSFGTDKFNVTMGADGYRLLTTGPSAFGLGEAAAFISLQIDKDRLPAGTGLDEVRLYYFDRQMNQWAIVPGCRFDEATQSMMAPSVGETDYVAGVLQNPEMPQASGFVPTSISGLDAANPAAGMNLMQPPTANASGAANISYPLEIPAGRNGMQPSLALTYSNEGGSSWVGYGWNLSAPSISIDTRWGVPRFDPNYETELYSYGGNHLVYPGNYLPHRTFTEYNDSTGAPMYARTSGTVRFFEQNTRSYKTIERKGTSTSGYFWVITDSEGTKQYYGTTDGTSQDAGSVLKNAQGHAVDWKLTKVIDKWGNYMTYEYISKSYTSTGNNIVDGSTALILKKITYTGHGTDIGKYSVEFKLKSWSGSNYRMDGRVSNRLGSAHADIETLDKVVVQYNGTEVKHYQLGYTQGAFYKNLLTQITETRNGSVFTTHELDYYDLPGVVYTDTVSSDQRINTDLKVPLSILPTRDLLALGLSPGSRSYYTGMSPIGSSSNAGFNFQGRYGIGPSFKLTQQEMDDISEAMESLYGSDMAEQLTKDWSRAILTFTADNSNSGTFGAFLSYGMNGTKGMVSMQDVDGDGLSDIVRKVGSKLYVRKLYRDSTLTMRYGPEQLLNTNMTVMGKSRSSNLSFGIDYHSPKLKKLKLLEFSLGLTLNKNWSTTRGYIMDYNRDGIIDIVERKSWLDDRYVVYFGERDFENDSIRFTPSSENTPSPVIKGSELDLEQDVDFTQFTEIVKVWTAPIAGTVNITDSLWFTGASNDGVRYAIQKSIQTGDTSSSSSFLTSFEPVTSYKKFTHLGISVQQGEKIFFRINPNADGYEDEIQHNPAVTYANKSAVDPNGVDFYSSNYAESFILSSFGSGQGVSTYDTYSFGMPSLTVNPSDSLLFGILHIGIDSNGYKVLHSYDAVAAPNQNTTLSANNFGSVVLNHDSLSIDSTQSASVYFFVSSRSNVDWKNIDWRPYIYNSVDTIYPIVDYGMYTKLVKHSDGKDITSSTYQNANTITLTTSFNIIQGIYAPNGKEGYLVAKADDTYLGSIHLKSNGFGFVKTPSSISFPGSSLSGKAKLRVEYYTSDTTLAGFFNRSAQYNLNVDGTNENNITSISVYQRVPDELTGHNYLNWGQFAWTDTNEVAIGVHELGLFSSQGIPDAFDFNSDDNGLDSLEAFDLEEEYSIFKQKFIPLFPVRKEVIEQDSLLAPRSTGENAPLRVVPQGAIAQDRYTGLDKSLFASELRTNSGYSGSNTLDEEYNNIAYVESRYNASGSPKKSTSLTANFSTSFGVEWGLGDKTKLKPGVSYNRSIPVPSLFFGRTKVDFMDLNGDGFADQITTKKIFGKGVYARYTNPLGGAMDTIRIDSSRFSITKTIPSTNTFSVSGAIEGLKTEGKSNALIKGAGAVRKAIGAVVTPPSLTFSNHWSRMGWYDINGDGLPDFLQGYKDSSTLAINLNNGYYIDTTHRLLQGNVTRSLSQTKAFSIGVSTPSFSTDRDSWGIGAGLSGGNQKGKIGLIDLNGDGLVDQLSFDGNDDPIIAINTGTKFQSLSASVLGYNPELFMFSFDVGASIRVKRTFEKHKMSKSTPYSMRKHAFSIGGSANGGLSRVHLQFTDINGDGFVDILRTDPPVGNQDSTTLHKAAEIGIWYNQTGTTNMLKGVNNPLGGSFELTYDLVGNKYGTYPNVIEMENANDDSTYWDMPNSKWVLKTVTVDDGFDLQDDSKNDMDGTDSFTTAFNYDGGIYSRRNRVFMYFTKIETVSPGGSNRSVVVHRAPTSNGTVTNRQYAYYGAIPVQTYGFAQGTGVGYWETVSRATNRIKVYPVHTTGTYQGQVDVTNELWVDTLAEDLVVFIAMDSTVSIQNPVIGGSTAFSQSQKLEYDSYMNVTKAIDGGLDGEIGTSDDLVSTMTYFTPSNAAGRTGQIKEHKVYKQVVSSNNMLRHSKVQQLTSGSLAAKELRRYLNTTDFAQSDYEYDTYGNITKMTGPENASAQRDTVKVTYDNVVHTYPIKVENAFSDYTQTTYDYSTGQVLTSEDLNGNKIQYTYDDFFRIEKILGPKEDHGNPDDFTIRYQYFPLGRHPESATWEDRVPVAVTYHYQDQGDASNVNYVSGINDDVVANPGIKEYTYNSGMWVATMETSKNHLMTATFTDGLGRAVQVKKDISLWNGLQQVESRQVSGATKIDVRGLPTSQYLSVSEQNDETVFPLLRYNRTLSSISPTTTSYDYLGRAVSVSSPDAAGTGSYTATVSYGWENKSGDDYFVTTSTDPDGRKNKVYVDARGQQRFTVADPNGVNAETEFFYDVLGQLTSTQSVDDETTSFTYDKFGRVTQEVHPDRGTTTTEYDLLGQVVSTTNANGQQVDYDYNYSRLTDISYPISGDLNDISYTYGSRGDGINGAGRVTEITQGLATAPVLVEKMNYDELGNVAVHTREIDIPNVGIQSFTSKTQYDSWGRILKMTYPDGEQVRYFHSFGGDLFRINGYNLGNTVLTVPSESYVKQLGYDQYGNRTYMEYGNGTKTTFEYNANTLRLNEVTALTSALNSTGMAQGMISKTFDYTGAGNIIEINNAATHVNFPYNNLGGGYHNLYAYDGLNRLTNATGDWLGATGPENYSVSMTYDNMGGIVQKNQTASLNYPGYPGEKYNYYYTQGNTTHPHATSKVWDRRNHKQYTYGFDSNGNPTTTHEQYAPPLQGQPNPSGPIDLIQQNYWDEQNQLRGLWNLSGLHHYIYDADGQRLMKSSVPMSYSSVNAQQLQATNSITAQDYTVYVSAGLVYESNGGSTTYTKHYYAGPLRVASQIGSANPNYETHPLGGQIAPGGPANTTPESYGVAALSDLNTLLANYGMAVNANEPPQDILSMQVINDPDECRMFYGDDLIEENRCLCDNFPDIAIQQGIDCNPYTPIYWYHPDYIGNIEFVTDRTGQPYQHFYYAAFGDPMVSQHVGTGSFNSAYRFNAKEFDEETGNYYYGARYYQPKSSIWMGVDALATSYPGMNPYNFVKGNPIMAIDPDGDTVTVNGDQSRMFVNELNKRLGDELKIRRDKENGTLSYEFKGDENNISQEAQSVMDAIDDDKIMVNIEASKSGIMSDGKVVPGGSFLGTTLSPDKKCVETSQKVVPFLLKALDKAGGAQRGQSQLHELLESYEAGKLSLQQGINAKPGGAIYNQAHGTVPPQGFDPSSIGAFVDPKTGWVHFYFNGDIYVQTLRN